MYGYLITKNVPSMENVETLTDSQILRDKEICFYYSPLPKFEKDHLFYEDEEKIVLLDGVIFNKRELLTFYRENDWRKTFEKIYHRDPITFFNCFRGSFCGAVWEKNTNTLILFTNHSGERAVYYTQQRSFFAAATHNNILTGFLQKQGIVLSPNIQACRELLTIGSILHGGTPFESVYRLTAGKYLTVESDENYKEIRYHMFHNVPEHDMSLDECIEEFDKRFRKAVDRIFSKNEEYGYKPECDLSGGLDSRMVTWIAHDLGYKKLLNVCYCQSNKIDHKTSQKIAHDLGNDYFFLPMDEGNILMDVDEVVDKFGGQVIYDVCTGANQALKEMVRRGVALSVTGLLGELHNAYWIEGTTHTSPNYIHIRRSNIVHLSIPIEYKTEYDNYEQMNLYEFSNLLYLSSAIVRQGSCEVTSPFIDVDFLEFAYRIPLKYRLSYQLTTTWMMKKYPESAQYLWQTKRMPVSNYYNHKIYWPKVINDLTYIPKDFVNRVAWKLHVPLQFIQYSDMNPINFWLLKNKDLKEFMTDYYHENIDLVIDQKLKEDVKKTFEKGFGMDKSCAINLLGVYKRYFSNQ